MQVLKRSSIQRVQYLPLGEYTLGVLGRPRVDPPSHREVNLIPAFHCTLLRLPYRCTSLIRNRPPPLGPP